ncbi:MAG: GntR family transcriptional regulator [Magnetospirillum gryphiswaldense]|nr:GntR family transcriptional regulator [Magnetospirillum gryphiswaldense]
MPSNPSAVGCAKVTMAERVWQQLAVEIVSGDVAGGRRLDEVEQAQRLGVSRTPLRESLRQLAALGLVENRPHRGVVVADGVGAGLFEVLAELEAACARSAAEKLAPDQAEVLRRLPADAMTILPWLREASGNSVLRGLLNTLWYPLVKNCQAQTAECQALIQSLRDSVVAGDANQAADAALAYVRRCRQLFLG